MRIKNKKVASTTPPRLILLRFNFKYRQIGIDFKSYPLHFRLKYVQVYFSSWLSLY